MFGKACQRDLQTIDSSCPLRSNGTLNKIHNRSKILIDIPNSTQAADATPHTHRRVYNNAGSDWNGISLVDRTPGTHGLFLMHPAPCLFRPELSDPPIREITGKKPIWEPMRSACCSNLQGFHALFRSR